MKETDKARKKRTENKIITSHPFFDWLQDLMRTKKDEVNMVMQVDAMIKRRNEIRNESEFNAMKKWVTKKENQWLK